MKLWKRRPLSEDLSQKDLNILEEMPPTLVYISPGNQKISKRSSLTSNDPSVKFQCPLELNSFHITSNDIDNVNKTLQRNCYCLSFKNYETKSFNKLDEGTLKSINTTIKDCKSYLPPVSSEWSPVKDVMKICRSASLPFHSRKSSKLETQEININQISNTKSPHLSLSEKIKIFFRNRSTSRSSKPTLTSITENKSLKSTKDSSKVICRNSRSRVKDSERCKSLYEPTQNIDRDYFHKSNQIVKLKSSQINNICNKNLNAQKCSSKEKKQTEKNVQSIKKEKVERKVINAIDNQKRIKMQSNNYESSQRTPVRGFSSSVVSHTTSSAAKCKSTSPKTPENNHNYQKNIRNSDKISDRNLVHRSNEISTSSFHRKPSKIHDSSDFCQIDSSISQKPPQSGVTKSDKKCSSFIKSDSFVTRSARFESKGCIQKSEYLLPNRVMIPNFQNSEIRTSSNDNKKYINNNDDEDYVTLAEIDLPNPTNNAFMSQSLYTSVLPEYSRYNQNQENDENQFNNQNTPINQHKEFISLKNKPRMLHVSGEIRKRPISCMAVVNADCRISSPGSKPNEISENLYPKSPYLSQYSKLYSLRANDMEIVQRYGNELSDLDLMTRSQHSGYYRMPCTISKDQTGKLSIDSGLVDDINVFHPECLQQTQNY